MTALRVVDWADDEDAPVRDPSSMAPVVEQATSYPVSWRQEGRPLAVGKLVLEADAAVLSGTSRDHRRVVDTVPYAEIASVHKGRARGERLNGLVAVVIERRGKAALTVAVFGAGLVGEVVDLLVRLAP